MLNFLLTLYSSSRLLVMPSKGLRVQVLLRPKPSLLKFLILLRLCLLPPRRLKLVTLLKIPTLRLFLSYLMSLHSLLLLRMLPLLPSWKLVTMVLRNNRLMHPQMQPLLPLSFPPPCLPLIVDTSLPLKPLQRWSTARPTPS
jgi:hypothetical protein